LSRPASVGSKSIDERTGRYRFSDFTRDEADMARLFDEELIRD
jgi:hypothetical protein